MFLNFAYNTTFIAVKLFCAKMNRRSSNQSSLHLPCEPAKIKHLNGVLRSTMCEAEFFFPDTLNSGRYNQLPQGFSSIPGYRPGPGSIRATQADNHVPQIQRGYPTAKTSPQTMQPPHPKEGKRLFSHHKCKPEIYVEWGTYYNCSQRAAAWPKGVIPI